MRSRIKKYSQAAVFRLRVPGIFFIYGDNKIACEEDDEKTKKREKGEKRMKIMIRNLIKECLKKKSPRLKI